MALSSDLAPVLSVDRPRWHRVYYMLAAFDVFTVALSLTLNHQIVKSYSRSIDSNIGWVEVINHAWLVSRLSAAIDAPANNVFESSDVAAESARIQTAAAEFDKMIEAIRSSLNAMAETPQHEALRNNATEALRLKNQMVEQSRQLFDRLSHGQREQAIHNMVSMNQANSSILGLMSEFHNKIRQIRIDEFNRQTGSARWLQGFEWIVGGLMLVMIGFATLWGFRLARRATQEAVRQQRYNQELERQVALRTDELNLAFGRHGDLIRQLISAQEDERSRIARDLHDEIGQSLTSLAIGMRSLDDAQDLYAVHERSGELRRIAVHAADEVRRLARGLRPAVLDDLGLNAALERLASDCEQVHGLTVHLHAAGPVAPRLSGTLETALYRIIQEALNNIVKHAGANQVWIDLDRQPEKITAVVADDGAGIASDSLQRAHHSGRLGVSGMRERATLLGGSLEIRRRSAGGTAVQVVLPLDGGLTGG